MKKKKVLQYLQPQNHPKEQYWLFATSLQVQHKMKTPPTFISSHHISSFFGSSWFGVVFQFVVKELVKHAWSFTSNVHQPLWMKREDGCSSKRLAMSRDTYSRLQRKYSMMWLSKKGVTVTRGNRKGCHQHDST